MSVALRRTSRSAIALRAPSIISSAGTPLTVTRTSASNSRPITAATFILLPKQPQDEAATTEALKFFSWIEEARPTW